MALNGQNQPDLHIYNNYLTDKINQPMNDRRLTEQVKVLNFSFVFFKLFSSKVEKVRNSRSRRIITKIIDPKIPEQLLNGTVEPQRALVLAVKLELERRNQHSNEAHINTPISLSVNAMNEKQFSILRIEPLRTLFQKQIASLASIFQTEALW